MRWPWGVTPVPVRIRPRLLTYDDSAPAGKGPTYHKPTTADLTDQKETPGNRVGSVWLAARNGPIFWRVGTDYAGLRQAISRLHYFWLWPIGIGNLRNLRPSATHEPGIVYDCRFFARFLSRIPVSNGNLLCRNDAPLFHSRLDADHGDLAYRLIAPLKRMTPRGARRRPCRRS